jgi:hypothetical protein
MRLPAPERGNTLRAKPVLPRHGISRTSFRDCPNNVRSCLRASMASFVYRPCLSAFLLFLGAPVSGCTAMHPTASDRRRSAGSGRSGLCTTAHASQHRTNVARVITGHLRGLRSTGTGVISASPTVFIGRVVEWVTALSGTGCREF